MPGRIRLIELCCVFQKKAPRHGQRPAQKQAGEFEDRRLQEIHCIAKTGNDSLLA
jgi:hypothetical protein